MPQPRFAQKVRRGDFIHPNDGTVEIDLSFFAYALRGRQMKEVAP